jgi:(p)ppGpp synthase/HD superfamily hydrolase
MVRYELLVTDNPGILSKVSGVTAKHKSNIRQVSLDKISQTVAKIRIVFDVSNTGQLQLIYADFLKSKGVLSVIRRKIVSE